MTVLITGNDPRVVKSLSTALCQDNKVVAVIKNAKSIGLDKHVVPFSLKPGDQMYKKLFSSFEFNTVIFITSRHLRNKAEQSGELDDLEQVLNLAKGEQVGQVIVVSSSEVYGGNMEINEAANPLPLGISGLMLESEEQLCRYYRENFGMNTVILHVPYLYGDEGADLFTDKVLRRCMEGRNVELPGASDDRCDFLCEADLADLLLRMIDEPYSLDSGAINLESGSSLTFGELAGYLKNIFPDAQFQFSSVKASYPVPVKVETARRYYDWIASRRFSEDLYKLIERNKSFLSKEESIWKRISSFIQSNQLLKRILEVFLGFLLMEYLNNITHTAAQYRFIDFRLLFVVIMGVTHGVRTGVVAALLASVSYAIGYFKTGADWEVLFYNIDNWLPLVAYFIAGAVVGNSKDKALNRELILKNQQTTLEERYVFLYELYDQTVANKNTFKDQLIGYRDSFGRIYDAVSRLDSLEHEEIFFKAIQVLEDVLEVKTVAFYTADAGMHYARLVASSEGMDARLSSSLKMSDHELMREAILKEGIWCNKILDDNEPAYCAPLFDKGVVVAMIVLWNVDYNQLTAAYLNLFIVLSRLVEASLVRAVAFRAITEQNLFLPQTRIMVSPQFINLIKIKMQMLENNIAKFKLLRVDTEPVEPVWLSDTILPCIRSTDALGQLEDSRYYVLLSQADEANVGLVLKRLSERGIVCSIIEGGLKL